jgi:hypothetical protein
MFECVLKFLKFGCSKKNVRFCVWIFPLKDFSGGISSSKIPNVLSYGEEPTQKKSIWIGTLFSSTQLALVKRISDLTHTYKNNY